MVEAVKCTGYAVLNADDPYCLQIGKRLRGEVIYFSTQKNQLFIQDHMKSGGKAAYIKNQSIILFDGRKEHPLLSIKEIPATLKGLLECNIKNSLTAAAGAFALGIPLEVIQRGLRSFKTDVVDNPGRFNIHRQVQIFYFYTHPRSSQKLEYHPVGCGGCYPPIPWIHHPC